MSKSDYDKFWPGGTSKPYRHSWADLSEDLPVDVMPCSNDEYFPPPPTKEQIGIMQLQSREIERYRRDVSAVELLTGSDVADGHEVRGGRVGACAAVGREHTDRTGRDEEPSGHRPATG